MLELDELYQAEGEVLCSNLEDRSLAKEDEEAEADNTEVYFQVPQQDGEFKITDESPNEESQAQTHKSTDLTNIETGSIQAELEQLKRELKIAQDVANEIAQGYRELAELYPGADLASMPDSFDNAVKRGIPPAAAYALELRKRQVAQERAAEARREAKKRASGKQEPADDHLYSPDEVRAMSGDEVRRNIERIKRSMKRW